MSRITREPLALAVRIAFLCAASVLGLAKCVPVTSTEAEDFTKSSSMSDSDRAESAQLSR